MTKTISFTTETGFPTEAYLSMVDWLTTNGYTVKKVKDWLTINPKTQYHQDVVARRQALEQSLGRVMANVSDLRRDIELLKHDLRRFEAVLDHHKKGNLEVLKSDYVDFVDKETQSSMLKLAAAGRFPSIVVDFFKIKNEDDIDKLKITKSEKSLLKVKWKLFNEWREKYSKAVEDRVNILRNEINSRNASLQNYMDSIKPYLSAIHKIKISEEHPTDWLSDPALVEGYSTHVAGVELVAWRGVAIQGAKEYMTGLKQPKGVSEKSFEKFIFFTVKITRTNVIVKGKEIEKMKVVIVSDLKTAREVEDTEKQIQANEETMLRSIEQFRGAPEKKEKKEEKKETTVVHEIIKATRSGASAIGSTFFPLPNNDPVLKKTVEEQTIAFYDEIKRIIGGLKFQIYFHEER